MAYQEIIKIGKKLVYGQVVDLAVEIVADSPNFPRIDIYGLGLQACQLQVLQVFVVVRIKFRGGWASWCSL